MLRLLVFWNVLEQGGLVDEALVARVALVGFVRLQKESDFKKTPREPSRGKLRIMISIEKRYTILAGKEPKKCINLQTVLPGGILSVTVDLTVVKRPWCNRGDDTCRVCRLVKR